MLSDRVFDLTWFANPRATDIRNLNPYAAYDVVNGTWAVHPEHYVTAPKLPAGVRRALQGADTYARQILSLPEPQRTREAASLFESWHTDRNLAFGPTGLGVFDYANLRMKALESTGTWQELQAAANRLAGRTATMQGKDYDGTVGNSDHITRSEVGDMPIRAIKHLRGARGEIPGEHRNRKGQDWEDFKADIAANGIRNPIFVTVDHGKEPVLNEGSHRRDAAVELGMTHVPTEVRYFGHAEQQGTVEDRSQGDRRTASSMYHWAPKNAADDIAEHGLDHTRSPFYDPNGHGPHGVFLHHTPELAHDWAPGVEHTHDLYEVDTHGLQLHPDPYDTGDASYSPRPVPSDRLRRV